MGDFDSRIGKASNPNKNIGQYGEMANNKNGAEVLRYGMPTLNDRVKKPAPK